MKKIGLLILMVVICMAVTACGESDEISGSSKNTIDWPADFYGEAIPAPEGYSKVAELSEKTDMTGDIVTTVRIDGMTWDEYKAYCKKLEETSKWTSDEDNKELYETLGENGIFDFRGTYGNLPRVTLTCFGTKMAENKEMPTFSMFVYKTYN